MKRLMNVLVWLLVNAAVIAVAIIVGGHTPTWVGAVVIGACIVGLVVFDTSLLRRLRNRLDRRSRRMKQGFCPECGYDLRGEFTRPCSECGWVMPVYRAGTRDS